MEAEMDTGPDSPSTSPGTDVTTYDAKRNVVAQESHNGRLSPAERDDTSDITPVNVPDVVMAHVRDDDEPTLDAGFGERLIVLGCHLRYAIEWTFRWNLRRRQKRALETLWRMRTTKKIYAFLNSKGSSGKTAGSTTTGLLYADAIRRDCVAVDMNDSPGGTARRLGIRRDETLNLREYLRKYRGEERPTAESISRDLEWTRDAGLFVISSESIANTTDDPGGRDRVKEGLEQLAESVHSVFCDLGNSIKSVGNWSAVEIADTLVFMGNVNAADSVVDFGKDDPTGEGDDLMSTMDAYRGMGMPTKVREGIIVILGAQSGMRMRRKYADHYGVGIDQVYIIPTNRYMKRGNVVRKNRLPLAVRTVVYEILVAMVKARRPPDSEIVRPKRSVYRRDPRKEGPEDVRNPTLEGDTESIPRIGPAPPPPPEAS
jgi:cellulose biosynthesis protein BcsQ